VFSNCELFISTLLTTLHVTTYLPYEHFTTFFLYCATDTTWCIIIKKNVCHIVDGVTVTSQFCLRKKNGVLDIADLRACKCHSHTNVSIVFYRVKAFCNKSTNVRNLIPSR